MGEALNQLSKLDATLAAQLPDLPQIVAFRNQLIHGYATVNFWAASPRPRCWCFWVSRGRGFEPDWQVLSFLTTSGLCWHNRQHAR
jgi:hypothetical protein